MNRSMIFWIATCVNFVAIVTVTGQEPVAGGRSSKPSRKMEDMLQFKLRLLFECADSKTGITDTADAIETLTIALGNREHLERRTVEKLLEKRGDNYRSLREYAKAKADYEMALAFTNGRELFLRCKIARALCGKGDTKAGFKLVSEILTREPDSPYVHAFMGQLYLLEERAKLAVHHCSKCLQLNHDVAHMYLFRALAYEMLGKTELCFADLNAFIQIRPFGLADFRPVETAYLKRAIILLDKRQYHEALRDVNYAKKLNRDSVPALRLHWWIYTKAGHKFAAYSVASKMLKRFPNDLDALNAFSRSLICLNELERAKKYITRTIKVHPKAPYPRELAGWYFTLKKDYSNALKCYEKAVELDPRSGQSLYKLAELLACCPTKSDQNLPKAFKVIAKLRQFSTNKNKFRVDYLHACALAENKDYEAAIRSIQRCIANCPKTDPLLPEYQRVESLIENRQPLRVFGHKTTLPDN